MARRVVVIGGGIIGLSSAYFLSREGHQVMVIDQSDIGSGASFVNAGYLTPSHVVPLAAPGMISKIFVHLMHRSSPVSIKSRWDMEFLHWAWQFKRSATRRKVERAMPIIRDINLLSRELYEGLLASGELGDFHLERKGLLMLYRTERAGSHEFDLAEKARTLGLPVEHLGPLQLTELEPHVDRNVLGAFHYHCDGHTTPPEFMEGLLNGLERYGVQVLTSEQVLDFVRENGKILKVVTDKGSHNADEVVLAAGCWTGHLAKKMGIRLPLEAGKGYCIDIVRQTHITMPAILCEAKVAVTPMRGFTRFAGSMEFSGIDHTVRRRRVGVMAKAATQFYGGLRFSDIELHGAQSGLRPVSPDGLPYIGRSTAVPNLILATGHAMMGWSLGPATGKLVSELVSDRKPSMSMEAFDPQRFGLRPSTR